MGSTRQDRSLSSGISLPQWMKGRTDSRFDFDDTTFSPPSHDDSFFYIRYPKTQNRLSVSQDFRPIDEVFNEQNITPSTNNIKAQDTQQQIIEEKKKNQEIDFSKHPLPCQPFIPATNKGNETKPSLKTSTNNTKITKSQGVDDGFHGEPALCGKSIVLVASQIMSNKLHENFSAEQAADKQYKKGSKSLPATPLASPAGSPSSSPKTRRRVPSNREIVTGKIDEEDETDVSTPSLKAFARKKSISSQNLTYVGSDEKPVEKPAFSNVFQAKPSELREMNFWSPTSM